MLASGLSDVIANDESLARFLTSSSQFNSHGVKHSAFLPNPSDHTTSVFRHSGEPIAELWRIGKEEAARERTLYGASIVAAGDIRDLGLQALADEPPLRHGIICDWPFDKSDPDLEKGKQKAIAMGIAAKSRLLRT